MRLRLMWIPLLLALSACVPQRQWRTVPFYSPGGDANARVEERFVIPPDLDNNRMYSMAFVEFKNDGALWDQRQLSEALRAVEDADRRSSHHAVVIVFIHGWKNNARPDNNNVLDFRKQLNRIAGDACKGDKEHCGVTGIYLAWSGDVITRDWDTLRNLSYFDRRGTATSVAVPHTPTPAEAALAPIGNALFEIMKQAKDGPGRTSNHCVVVGHSFGGLILEYAIADRMRKLGDELHAELGKHTTTDAVQLKSLNDFADLVVLINQAAPAARAVKLLSQYRQDLQKVNLLKSPMRAHCPAGDPAQECKALTRPLILSISSTGDLATRTVLPIVETVFPPKDTPRELPGVQLPPGLDVKKVFTTAAAHTPQLQSHRVIECVGGDCSPCLKYDKFYIPVSIVLPGYAPGNDTKDDEKINYCVVRDFKAWNRTPYWIFEIPTKIVPDHSTIFTDRFTDFLTSFLPPLEQFQSSQPPPPPAQRLYIKADQSQ